MAAAVSALAYELPAEENVKWTVSQEKQILKDVPWIEQPPTQPDQAGPSSGTSDAEAFLARTYLQYLWLPESIMPLTGLVHALRRISHTSSNDCTDTTTPHPLHALLDPLLLTARSASHKYHTELTAILAAGGGEGEAEEAMMWFAFEHEKHGDAPDRPIDDDDPSAMDADPAATEDAEAQWQSRWLDRMERRERHAAPTRHAHPPPTTTTTTQTSTPAQPPSPRKRRRKDPEPAPLAPEVYLEAFMDKLSMWQLVRGLDPRLRAKPSPAPGRSTAADDERDWMQVFCEDVVEVLFKQDLPDLCALLRSKVFPHSPFSDTESEDEDEGRMMADEGRLGADKGLFGADRAHSKARRDGSEIAYRDRSETYRDRSRSRASSIGDWDPDTSSGNDWDPRSSSGGDWDPRSSSGNDDWDDDVETLRAPSAGIAGRAPSAGIAGRAPSASIPGRASTKRPSAAPLQPPSRAASLARSNSVAARSSAGRASSSQPRAPINARTSSSTSSRTSSARNSASNSASARQLARSRSLSLSLAQEQAERAAGTNVKRKRVISREISMSRVLRPGKSVEPDGAVGGRSLTPGAAGNRGLTPGVAGSRGLTPVSEEVRKEKEKEEREKGKGALGTVLVGDTPVKKATKVFL
ncbi:hypothetical protein BD626DRAFT_571758 [Schizophyllum amplum]|uniref:DNA replication regulator Sld3 C-terminal domain-containing protein n=1 Tax=Schizophyllum amplum TaxID=97359 RepID=A0A550C6J0_9AGAR|nr:hypothetical protein BD626DRAFT_571758 [Auriculariopsis ampla]